jgi:hypothetical protein
MDSFLIPARLGPSPGVLLVPFEDAVLVVAHGKLEKVRFQAPKVVVELMVKLLGETCSSNDLMGCVPEQYRCRAQNVVLLLLVSGAIVGRSNQGPQTSPTHLRSYASMAVTPQLLPAVPQCVAILCLQRDRAICDSLAQILNNCGFRASTVVLTEPIDRHVGNVGNSCLIIAFEHLRSHSQFTSSVVRACHESRSRCLRVTLSGSGAYCDIGPLYTPMAQGCVDCFLQMHYFPEQYDQQSAQVGSPDSLFLLGILGLEIASLVDPLGYSISKFGAHRIDMKSGLGAYLRCTQLPGCLHGTRRLGDSRTIQHKAEATWTSTALVFEDYVRLDTPESLPNKAD